MVSLGMRAADNKSLVVLHLSLGGLPGQGAPGLAVER